MHTTVLEKKSHAESLLNFHSILFSAYRITTSLVVSTTIIFRLYSSAFISSLIIFLGRYGYSFTVEVQSKFWTLNRNNITVVGFVIYNLFKIVFTNIDEFLNHTHSLYSPPAPFLYRYTNISCTFLCSRRLKVCCFAYNILCMYTYLKEIVIESMDWINCLNLRYITRRTLIKPSRQKENKFLTAMLLMAL